MEVSAAEGKLAAVQLGAETVEFVVEVVVFAEESAGHIAEIGPWLLPPMDLGPHQRCRPVPKLVAPIAEAVPHFAEAQPTAPDSGGRFVAKQPKWLDFAASNVSVALPAAAGVDLTVATAVVVGVVVAVAVAGIVVVVAVGPH